MTRVVTGASSVGSFLLAQLGGAHVHAPFLEPLQCNYDVSSSHLQCSDEHGSKLYEIEFRDGPPVGGLALSELAPKVSTKRVLDLGTGNGIIAIAMAANGCKSVFAVDISERDCRLATGNARRNHKEHAISVLRGDLASPLMGKAIDSILSNPPQLPTNVDNPDTRNFAGPTGYEIIDRIISESKDCLTTSGELWLYVLGFLGVEKSTGSLPSLFASLRMSGFHPKVIRKLRRRCSKDVNIQEALPLIQDLYPISDIARNSTTAGYYEVFVVRGSKLACEDSRH